MAQIWLGKLKPLDMNGTVLDKSASPGKIVKREFVSRLKYALLGVGGLFVIIAFISCSTTSTRTLMAPPQIAGAEFVGSQTCAECHANIVRDFKAATHVRLKAEGANAKDVGCESCHGAGSLHNQSGGARDTIINPNKSPEVCFQCHLDKKAQFQLAHSHPVMSGKVSCSNCHDPHKGSAVRGGGTALMTEHDTCGQCHTAQRGPFVFEHEAVREGCTTCHDPHGTVNDKMLIALNANLCLKCHFQQQTPSGIVIGGSNHGTASRLGRGTCWSAGCHEAVHGSQIGSSLRF
jgi:predicted CXXCH cytochrome family protein